MIIRTIAVLTTMFLLTLAGCTWTITPPDEASVSTESATVQDGPVRIDSQGEVPFYARFGENETFSDGEWTAIVFYRPPDCIPPDFNLNQFFHFPDNDGPGAFACGPPTTTGIETWKNGPESDPAPLMAEVTGQGAVPVWFFVQSEVESAIADSEVTIGELAALPSRMVGTASTYTELLHPSQTNSAPMIQFTAEGTLEDGRAFFVDVSNGAADVNDHVTLQFGEAAIAETGSAESFALDATGIMEEIGYTIDYPADWFWVSCFPGAAFAEVEADARNLCTGQSTPSGNRAGYDYRDISFMQRIGLADDPTLEDLLALNSEYFGYQDLQVTETTLFGEPALRVQSLVDGTPTIDIIGFHNGHVFIVGFDAPDEAALKAFLPTIEAMLGTITPEEE